MNVRAVLLFVVVVAVNIFFNNKETKLFVTPLPRGSPGAAATPSLSFGPRVMKGCGSHGLWPACRFVLCYAWAVHLPCSLSRHCRDTLPS